MITRYSEPRLLTGLSGGTDRLIVLGEHQALLALSQVRLYHRILEFRIERHGAIGRQCPGRCRPDHNGHRRTLFERALAGKTNQQILRFANWKAHVHRGRRFVFVFDLGLRQEHIHMPRHAASHRMNRKCDPQLAIDMMRSEAECMQCRSSGAGVDFCFDSPDVKVRQRQPFPPPDNDFLRFHVTCPLIQRRERHYQRLIDLINGQMSMAKWDERLHVTALERPSKNRSHPFQIFLFNSLDVLNT